MGKLLMLQEADAERIESLKKRLHARTKLVIGSVGSDLNRPAESRSTPQFTM